MARAADSRHIPAKKILVVDDILDVAETIQSMLTEFGHQVDISGSSANALSRYQPGKYDLVITDYAMPSMNGLELAKAIKKRDSRQLVLLLTAFVFSIAAETSQPLPVDFILSKPVSIKQFQEALAGLFPPD